MNSVTRRTAILGLLAFSSTAALAAPHPLYGSEAEAQNSFRDPSLFPPTESPVDFPIERVDLDTIPERFQRPVSEQRAAPKIPAPARRRPSG